MPRSDPPPWARVVRDGRGWIILAWVVWCGFLYGKMVVEQRGSKLQGSLTRIAQEVRCRSKT